MAPYHTVHHCPSQYATLPLICTHRVLQGIAGYYRPTNITYVNTLPSGPRHNARGVIMSGKRRPSVTPSLFDYLPSSKPTSAAAQLPHTFFSSHRERRSSPLLPEAKTLLLPLLLLSLLPLPLLPVARHTHTKGIRHLSKCGLTGACRRLRTPSAQTVCHRLPVHVNPHAARAVHAR